MSYFPAFIRFDNKRILIIGGGNIAFEKLEHLLDFTNNITLISLDFNAKTKNLINKNSLSYFQKAYEQGDIKDFDIVIAISTSGSSPAVAKQLKFWLNDLIPNTINDFLLEMKEYRKTMPKGMERMKFLEEKAKDYIRSWKEIK